MIRKLDCSFVFEWETPVVCPDQVKTLGCSVTDEQLHYTFNLTSLSGRSFEVKSSQKALLNFLECEKRLKCMLQLWSVSVAVCLLTEGVTLEHCLSMLLRGKFMNLLLGRRENFSLKGILIWP